MKRSLLILFLFIATQVFADDSDIIKADRQALADANASGSTTKILAAKEQLSDDLGTVAEEKRKDLEGYTIPLTPDGQGHLLADVLINGSVHASLVVDTGSPMVMLTPEYAQQLGLDLSQAQTGYVEVLNGKYKAAEVSLNSVKVGNAEAMDVNTTVLLEGGSQIKNGLLGLSYLSKFHFTLDQTGQRLILKRPE